MVRLKKNSVEWLKTIGIALIIAFVVRTFLFTSYVVDGQSMMPTLENGNLLMVNKMTYNIRDIKRFDVVVFHANESEDYVKRVIGLPGEHVAYKDNQLYINGELLEEPYLDEYKSEPHSLYRTADFSLEEITGESTIPEGKVFVIGDNRNGSYDSRDFGCIDIEQIVGKVNLRYWPLKDIGFKF